MTDNESRELAEEKIDRNVRQTIESELKSIQQLIDNGNVAEAKEKYAELAELDAGLLAALQGDIPKKIQRADQAGQEFAAEEVLRRKKAQEARQEYMKIVEELRILKSKEQKQRLLLNDVGTRLKGIKAYRKSATGFSGNLFGKLILITLAVMGAVLIFGRLTMPDQIDSVYMIMGFVMIGAAVLGKIADYVGLKNFDKNLNRMQDYYNKANAEMEEIITKEKDLERARKVARDTAEDYIAGIMDDVDED